VTGPLYSRARRDANEPAIRRVVEEFGGTFVPHSGSDEPDAFVGFAGLTEPWEIKVNTAKLRPGQKRWAERWRGRPSRVVRNEAQARCRLRVMAMDAGHGGGPDQSIEDAEDAEIERTRAVKGDQPS
jgi:hypothetical protein